MSLSCRSTFMTLKVSRLEESINIFNFDLQPFTCCLYSIWTTWVLYGHWSYLFALIRTNVPIPSFGSGASSAQSSARSLTLQPSTRSLFTVLSLESIWIVEWGHRTDYPSSTRCDVHCIVSPATCYTLSIMVMFLPQLSNPCLLLSLILKQSSDALKAFSLLSIAAVF